MSCEAEFELAVDSPLFTCEKPDRHEGPHSSLAATLWAARRLRDEGESAPNAVRRAAALLGDDY